MNIFITKVSSVLDSDLVFLGEFTFCSSVYFGLDE